MRLINVKAFVERERMISEGGRVDRRKKVLEFRDEDTAYAILSIGGSSMKEKPPKSTTRR